MSSRAVKTAMRKHETTLRGMNAIAEERGEPWRKPEWWIVRTMRWCRRGERKGRRR